MSTTTEPSLRRTGGALAAALCGWIGILAAVTLIAEPSRDVIVFGAPERTLRLLANTDVRIADVRPTYLIARGTQSGFVRALYANGAWLVLPARARSCFSIAERGL